MNSTKEKETALEAAIGPVFDEVIAPMAARMRMAGITPFPLQPDVTWLSYYVKRKHSMMSHEHFTNPSCIDAADLAARLAMHWRALGRHELADEAARFGSAAEGAQKLLAGDTLSPELSPYVYAMF